MKNNLKPSINLAVKPSSTLVNKTGGWRTFKPLTDFNKCVGCGRCAKVCPENCVIMKLNQEGKNKPVTDYNYCKGCGLCAAECPVKAIIMEKENK
jgi:2-oxoacid:acceptor oxidoreductase delta subunit (pyruvate/2-ketoisovalerate family)